MKRLLIILILLVSYIEADQLKEKYEMYTEYLGMKALDLDSKQLKEIVPKLEKKLSEDNEYKKMILQMKLNQLRTPNNIKQTICFSKQGQYLALIGDNVPLQDGMCGGRTLPEMNKEGWKLIQVISGLAGSFGMVLTKE